MRIGGEEEVAALGGTGFDGIGNGDDGHIDDASEGEVSSGGEGLGHFGKRFGEKGGGEKGEDEKEAGGHLWIFMFLMNGRKVEVDKCFGACEVRPPSGSRGAVWGFDHVFEGLVVGEGAMRLR